MAALLPLASTNQNCGILGRGPAFSISRKHNIILIAKQSKCQLIRHRQYYSIVLIIGRGGLYRSGHQEDFEQGGGGGFGIYDKRRKEAASRHIRQGTGLIACAFVMNITLHCSDITVRL
jgi:hypothetical protein